MNLKWTFYKTEIDRDCSFYISVFTTLQKQDAFLRAGTIKRGANDALAV